MLLDTHAHVITKGYFNNLIKSKVIPRIEPVKDGAYKLWFSRELSYTFDQKMLSVEKRLDEMDKAGIDFQVVSLSIPGADVFEKDLALEMARKANDEIAEIVRSNDRFLGFATVPMVEPHSAVEELERAVNSLGLKGVSVFSNVGGKTLDSGDFLPFYEGVSKLDVPIIIHPTRPLMVDVLKDYGLVGAVGYLFDTTLAVLRLIFSGVLEKFKKLKIILPHAGSTIPYLIGRIDHQYRLNPESRERISKPPSEYFKSIYIDTAQAFYEPATMCAYALAGPDKMVFGSDYPFASLEQSANVIKNMKIPDKEKEKLSYKNAANLLKLKI